MNRKVIPLQVRDEYIIGAGGVIGAEGSGNDVALQMEFGAMWEGLVKYVTFRNALGEDPEVMMVTADMMELLKEEKAEKPPLRKPGCFPPPPPPCPPKGEELPEKPVSYRVVYNVPVPRKAKAVAGEMMLTVHGYAVNEDGTQKEAAAVGATAYFRVLPAKWAEPETEGFEPPTVAQQMQAQIERIQTDIVEAAKAADAKAAAQKSAEAAAKSAGEAEQSAEAAAGSADEAKEWASVAKDISGGDFPTRDEALAELSAHNEDSSAHPYLLEEVKKPLRYISNPNLLDNGDFAAPINQRNIQSGKSWGAGQYGIDRWYSFIDGPYWDAPGYIVFPAGRTSNLVGQRLERFRLPQNEYITISALVDGQLLSDTRLYTGDNVYSIFDGSVLGSTSIMVTNQYMEFRLWALAENTADVKVRAVKLELGSQQTLAHQDVDGNWVLNDPPPNFALELGKCQRHQIALPAEGIIGVAHCYEDGMAYATIPLPTTLRGIPAIDKEKIVVVTGNYIYTGVHPTRIFNVAVSGNGIIMIINAPNLVAGKDYFLAPRPASATAPLIIDANL